MTDAQLQALLDAGKPVPYMLGAGGVPPTSPQESANRAWQALADELGFVWDTVQPIANKDRHWFTAEKRDAGGKENPYVR
jgi:hypothetical protein